VHCCRTYHARPAPQLVAGCGPALTGPRTRQHTAHSSHMSLSARSDTCILHNMHRGGTSAPLCTTRCRAVAVAAATADTRDYRKERMERKGKGSDRRNSSSSNLRGARQDRGPDSERLPAGQQQQRFRAKQGRRDPGLKQEFFARESWKEVGANAGMIDALKQLGITRPSHVQAEALVALFSGNSSMWSCQSHSFSVVWWLCSRGFGTLLDLLQASFQQVCRHVCSVRFDDVLYQPQKRFQQRRFTLNVAWSVEKRRVVVADQSGSGKTLAYLVPLIQQIKEQERSAGGPQTQPRKPRAVVLCPTEELCAQVLLTCRALSKACSCKMSRMFWNVCATSLNEVCTGLQLIFHLCACGCHLLVQQ
jgi:DEAD/DEAH box helicase